MDEFGRARVKKALLLEGAAQEHAVRALTSSDQLHQFVLNYNINDGYGPVRAVVNHQACDAGTALLVYWQFPPESRVTGSESPPDYDAAKLLSDIETRFREESFASSEIFFDPKAEMSRVQLYKLEKQGFSGLLSAVGSKRVQREWL